MIIVTALVILMDEAFPWPRYYFTRPTYPDAVAAEAATKNTSDLFRLQQGCSLVVFKTRFHATMHWQPDTLPFRNYA